MTLFDGSWLDGRVRILEPAAADAVATVPVSLPGASPGAPAAASLCYLQHAELLLASFEGTGCAILAQFWRNSGAILAQFCAIFLTRLLLYRRSSSSSWLTTPPPTSSCRAAPRRARS